MIAMNARAELQGVAFDAIARDHLAAKAAAAARRRARPRASGRKLVRRRPGPPDAQHLALVSVSVGAGGADRRAAGGAGVFRTRAARAVLLGATGLLQTMPSLALLALLIPLLGAIGTLPALIALTLYALLPIMRNTVTGLAEVPRGLREAGAALGMTRGQRLRLVELPLALPTHRGRHAHRDDDHHRHRDHRRLHRRRRLRRAHRHRPGAERPRPAAGRRVAGRALALLSEALFEAVTRFTQSRTHT